MLTGQDLAKLVDAMLDAFDESDLSALVLIHLNEDLAAIVASGPLRKQALDLVRWADRRGVVPDLVRAAYAERPKNTKWKDLQEAYGAAPAVSVQNAGGRYHGN